jgi:hypothetical protein
VEGAVEEDVDVATVCPEEELDTDDDTVRFRLCNTLSMS